MQETSTNIAILAFLPLHFGTCIVPHQPTSKDQ